MIAALLVWAGAALALAGVAGLGLIIRRARILAKSDDDPAQARAVLGRLAVWNAASLAAAAFGLALMIVGLVL